MRFVEGGQFDSLVIRYATRCRWSHVEAISTGFHARSFNGMTFGAMLFGGVGWRSQNSAAYRGVVGYELKTIRATADEESAFWEFLFAQDGKPYDWRAIVGFGLGERDWREADSWFCSELQARALEVAGLLRLPKDVPVWRITPRDVWLMTASLQTEQATGRNHRSSDVWNP